MPCIWVEVDQDASVDEQREFIIYGTGHDFRPEEGKTQHYIGTFQLAEGSLIFHLYEQKAY